jgi:fructokinase
MSSREHLFPRLRARLAKSIGGYGSLAGLDMTALVGAPGLGAMAGPLGSVAMGLEALGA